MSKSGNPHKKSRPRKPGPYDDLQTPPEALDFLVPYLPKRWRVWEPACGQGYLLRGFAERGYTAFGTDVKTGDDFFVVDTGIWDCIVTNPPYSVKFKWIARCYELGKPWALLLPVEILGAKTFQEMVLENGHVSCVVPPRRINFKTPRTSFEKSSSWFPTMWVLGLWASGGPWPAEDTSLEFARS